MSRHTPGPWEINPRTHTSVRQVGTERGIASAGAYRMSAVDPDVLYTENKANAHLIAAAPDLLEALEELLDVQNGPPMQLERHARRWEQAVQRAQAVIAKARGGS